MSTDQPVVGRQVEVKLRFDFFSADRGFDGQLNRSWVSAEFSPPDVSVLRAQ
jgi:hypothetical protein